MAELQLQMPTEKVVRNLMIMAMAKCDAICSCKYANGTREFRISMRERNIWKAIMLFLCRGWLRELDVHIYCPNARKTLKEEA